MSERGRITIEIRVPDGLPTRSRVRAMAGECVVAFALQTTESDNWGRVATARMMGSGVRMTQSHIMAMLEAMASSRGLPEGMVLEAVGRWVEERQARERAKGGGRKCRASRHA